MLPKALKSGPKSTKSPNLVTLREATSSNKKQPLEGVDDLDLTLNYKLSEYCGNKNIKMTTIVLLKEREREII